MDDAESELVEGDASTSRVPAGATTAATTSGASAAVLFALSRGLFVGRFSPIFPDSSRLSRETSPQTDSTPEASERYGSGRIEFSSKSTTCLM